MKKIHLQKSLPILAISTSLLLLCSACINLSLNPNKAKEPMELYTLATTPKQLGTTKLYEIPFSKIKIPSYLTSTKIILSNNEKLSALKNAHWAESLDRALQRELPLRTALLTQGKKLKNFSNISVEINRLDGPQSGPITLSAGIIILPIKGNSEQNELKIFTQKFPVETQDNIAYIKSISKAIDALALEIANSITLEQ